MLKYKFIALIIFILTSNSGFSQYTDVINSNRPGESMSAFSLGHSVFQTEFGGYYINENHEELLYKSTGFGADWVLRYGFYSDRLEAIANIQFQKDKYCSEFDTINRTGFRKIQLGAKFLLYDPNKTLEDKNDIRSWKKSRKNRLKEYLPAVSVYAGTNLNLPSNPFVQEIEPFFAPKAMIITQNQFKGSFVLVINAFMDKIMSPYVNYGYVVTLTKGLNDYWSVFVENKGIQGELYSDGIFTAGAAHLLDKNLQIDLSVSHNYKNTPVVFYGGMGVSWRFDANYKETLMRDTKLSEAEEKLQKQKEKNEKKTKKEQDKNEKKANKVKKGSKQKKSKKSKATEPKVEEEE